MPHYRVYIMDLRGNVKVAVGFDCADDEVANERVRALLDDQEAELWRLVASAELDREPT